MKLRFLVLVAGVALMHGAACAQIGLYATPVFTRASNSTPDSGVFAFLGPNSTSRLFSGVGFGLYDQFAHTERLDAGVDLRASLQSGAGAHLNEFLIGARVAFHPIGTRLKPYAEVLGGVGGTRAAHNPVYQNRATYGGVGGVDYAVSKHVDLRVIEIGYGSLQTINTPAVTQAAASSLPPASRLLTFSAGIVFTLPQKLIPLP